MWHRVLPCLLYRIQARSGLFLGGLSLPLQEALGPSSVVEKMVWSDGGGAREVVHKNNVRRAALACIIVLSCKL